MSKYSFLDDYSEGCHPNILAALMQTNLAQQTAYGSDAYSDNAKKLIGAMLKNPSSHVYFVAGGTLANVIVSSSVLRSHEAIISAETGHIVRQETGAIEATGHKVITRPSANGKLRPSDIQSALNNYSLVPHMVKPKLVYISNATETGTVYSKQELQYLSEFCKKAGLYLFLDGARLGAALCSEKSDLTLEDLSKLTDLFTLGGTKNGALIGEAIIINTPHLYEDFAFHIKQRGALLAKGRVLGIQFTELFRKNLYFDLACHANKMAQKLSEAIVRKGYSLTAETESNQIFAILPNNLINELSRAFDFYVWQKIDSEYSEIRFVTSWATDEQEIDRLIGMV